MPILENFDEFLSVDSTRLTVRAWGHQPAIIMDERNTQEIALCTRLQKKDRQMAPSSDKSLFLYVTPETALRFAAFILEMADHQSWNVPADVLNDINQFVKKLAKQ